jgi:nucleotide-binding universal stress UspA family protein
MFTRILVPLDSSPESNIALPLACVIALATGASTTLLRVLPTPDRTVPAESRFALDAACAELASSGVQVETVVRYGQPADEILNQIGAQGADRCR